MRSDDFESAWDDREIHTLQKMTKKYEKVKKLFLYAEEIDNKVTFLPASNEFRSAFDHLMRVYAFKFGIKSSENADYTHTNLDKSYGHIYRAGYDVLDYLQMKLTKNIVYTMEMYSIDTIEAVCPEYYKKIKRDLKLYAEEVAIIRSRKDVGNRNDAEFDKYVEIVNNLKKYDAAINEIEYLLAEYELKRTQERTRETRLNTLYTVVATLAVTGILWAISSYSNKSTSFILKSSSVANTSNSMMLLLLIFIAFAICYMYCAKGN